MSSQRNLVIAGLGVSIIGVYLANRDVINDSVQSFVERFYQVETIVEGGGAGEIRNGEIIDIGGSGPIPNSENIRSESYGTIREEVIDDALNFTLAQNAQGRNVTGSFDHERNRTTFSDTSTGQDTVIFDYRRNISTTPALDRQRELQEGASSREVFSGPLRPNDNEQLFRNTGITRPSDVLRSSSLGGFF